MSATNTEQPISIFLEPAGRGCDVAKTEAFRAAAGVEKRLLLLNNLGRDIIALERNGLKYDLATLNTPDFPRGFIVRVEYRFGWETYKKLEKHLHSPDADHNETLKTIRENITMPPFRRSGMSERICTLDYIVDNNVILNNGGRLYIDDIDLAICFKEQQEDLIHPYSARGRDLCMGVYLNWDKRAMSANVDFTYVTVLSNTPGLYARVMDRVVYVPPIFNPGVESGLHIDYSSIVEGAKDTPKRKKRIVEQESFEKFGFFSTYDEALTCADFETAHKLELAEAERKAALLRAENVQLEAQMRKLNIELEMQKTTVKGDQVKTESRISRKELKRKNRYGKKSERRQERSARREERTAIIKNMPAIILGVAAIGVAIGKLIA
jgi:hypothetical protein